MGYRGLREIVVWAALTAVVVGGLLTGGAAVSNLRAVQPAKPFANVGGCKITADARAVWLPNNVSLVMRAENPSSGVKRFDVVMSLVRRDFTGNPMSRVMRPDDYKETVERTLTVHLAPAGKGTAVKTVVMPIDARPAAKKSEIGGMVPSYEVRVGSGKQVAIASFSANLAWPKS